MTDTCGEAHAKSAAPEYKNIQQITCNINGAQAQRGNSEQSFSIIHHEQRSHDMDKHCRRDTDHEPVHIIAHVGDQVRIFRGGDSANAENHRGEKDTEQYDNNAGEQCQQRSDVKGSIGVLFLAGADQTRAGDRASGREKARQDHVHTGIRLQKRNSGINFRPQKPAGSDPVYEYGDDTCQFCEDQRKCCRQKHLIYITFSASRRLIIS